MALKVPIAGEISLLNTLLQNGNLHLHLFQNNYTPIASSVIGNFTEATFSGYSTTQPLPITTVKWTTPANDGAGRAIAFNATFNFSNSTGAVGNQIYGYYVTDLADATVLWAERFSSAPIDMTTAGKTMSMTPAFTLLSEF